LRGLCKGLLAKEGVWATDRGDPGEAVTKTLTAKWLGAGVGLIKLRRAITVADGHRESGILVAWRASILIPFTSFTPRNFVNAK
jgi:hypothetical protein